MADRKLTPKAETMWAIAHADAGILCGTYLRRDDAMRGLESDFGASWAHLRKNGYRALKVRVVPL